MNATAQSHHQAKAHLNLAAAARMAGCRDEALSAARRAAWLDPQRASGLIELGLAHQEFGRFERARHWYQEAIHREQNSAAAHVNLALASLLVGDLETGWREYAWRWRLAVADPSPERRLRAPRWDGCSLAGKTIYIHAEQGLGDDILFATCLPDLIAECGHVYVECDRRLVPLFARSLPSATIVGSKRQADVDLPDGEKSQIDFQLAAGCLPRFLRTTFAAFPRRQTLLAADPRRVAAWRERYAALGSGPKVGIAWRGGSDPSEIRRRSTSLDQWADVLQVPGVHFVNVQYGAVAAELDVVRQRFGVALHDWPDADPLTDVDDHAAQIAALNLVISVTNAGVHLAGALGVPVWTLLPYVPSWRWFLEREDSPWYPTARLFRQREPGDWAEVFRRVAAALTSWPAMRIERPSA